jgi:hypothetical protein
MLIEQIETKAAEARAKNALVAKGRFRAEAYCHNQIWLTIGRTIKP